MKNSKSLEEALSELRARGYEADFDADLFGLYSGDDEDMRLDPQDFRVDEVIRVEGESRSGDNTVVYAVEYCTGVKGFVVDKQERDSELPR